MRSHRPIFGINLFTKLWFALLIGVVSLLGVRVRLLAQIPQGAVESIRSIYPSEWHVPYPVGIAYASALEQLFLVDRTISSTSVGSTTVVAITPYEDFIASIDLPFALDNAINIAFDDTRARLFLLNSAQAQLAQVRIGTDGLLDSSSLIQFDITHLALDDAQGIAVDTEMATLFILDNETDQIISLPLTATGINDVVVSRMDLTKLGLDDLRGLALHPQTHHIFVGQNDGKSLIEVTQQGQLVAHYDIEPLRSFDPGGMLFAASLDRTDPATLLHLFVASGASPLGQSVRSQRAFVNRMNYQIDLPLVSRLKNLASKRMLGGASLENGRNQTCRGRAVTCTAYATICGSSLAVRCPNFGTHPMLGAHLTNNALFGRVDEIAIACQRCTDVVPVHATVETTPNANESVAAVDPAIWVHPTEPALSTILGTDQRGGLAVYDLMGNQLQYLTDGQLNSVDVRSDFVLGDETVALAVATDRRDDRIVIYRIDSETRRLTAAAARHLPTAAQPIGSCLYHSRITDTFYLFVSHRSGEVQQWELFRSANGAVDGTLVRNFHIGVAAEHCVADDELAQLYLSSAQVGIRKFEAEPDAGNGYTFVDVTRTGGHLTADVAGLAIFSTCDGEGYLLASSQGSSDFVLYKRRGNNDYLVTFSIVEGDGIDAVSNAGGIAVTNQMLGAQFPMGLFVAQDGDNEGRNQNFKLTPWQAIANAVTSILGGR